MGYKCPVCGTDFGRDKRKWEEHTKTAHDGAGQTIVDTVKNTCENSCFGRGYVNCRDNNRLCNQWRRCHAKALLLEKGAE